MISKCNPFQVAAVLLSLLPCAGQAQTSTVNFSVRMTIVAECAIASGGLVDFGNGRVLRASSNASTALQVTCSKATPYNLDLSTRSGAGEDAATRRSSAHATGYRLPQASSRTASRDRETRSFLVHGQAAPEATLLFGTYTDTVTVTVTY